MNEVCLRRTFLALGTTGGEKIVDVFPGRPAGFKCGFYAFIYCADDCMYWFIRKERDITDYGVFKALVWFGAEGDGCV